VRPGIGGVAAGPVLRAVVAVAVASALAVGAAACSGAGAAEGPAWTRPSAPSAGPTAEPVPDLPGPAGPPKITVDPRLGPIPSYLPSADPSAPVARPVRVRIDRIGLDSGLVDLVTDADRVLIPPQRYDIAGWYAAGPAPGAVGPAVIAGHVDSRSGPGVFFRLRQLRAGDVVTVDRADASTVRFVVQAVITVAKDRFPSELVYAPTPGPELRLITCGGPFDDSARSYRDNVVVQAVPVG
jgi:hypothetical protein